MNPKLAQINKLIMLCDQMCIIAANKGDLSTYDHTYIEYRKLIKEFCHNFNLNSKNYAPYVILDNYWTSNPGKLYLNEIQVIRKIVIFLKHQLFKNDYEKIFISHRELDRDSVSDFIELLHVIGIPRYTKNMSESMIFCSSHPEGYIQNGERNLDTIQSMLNTEQHIFYILWYTDNYFDSQACLNEAGAIWAMNKRYQEVLLPTFDETKIRGLLDKQKVWFRCNDKMRLNTFKGQIEQMFSISPINDNSWELSRDTFINKINK